MTWSILARDPATGALGAAVATRFFAVGALAIHVEGGVAALATQALINPMYAVHGMPRLQWFSIRGVSREHIRMAFSLWLLLRQRIAEHYFFGVFILLRATISEEDSPRVATAVIP